MKRSKDSSADTQTANARVPAGSVLAMKVSRCSAEHDDNDAEMDDDKDFDVDVDCVWGGEDDEEDDEKTRGGISESSVSSIARRSSWIANSRKTGQLRELSSIAGSKTPRITSESVRTSGTCVGEARDDELTAAISRIPPQLPPSRLPLLSVW